MVQPEHTAGISEAVYRFYRELPFNVYSSADQASESITAHNQVEQAYPDLHRIFSSKKTHSCVDCGCGGGWLSNTIAYYYKVPVVGLDFNRVALDCAEEVAAHLGLQMTWREQDLLDTSALKERFDLVLSIGVLHHTGDARRAFAEIVKLMSESPHARVYVGLYHTYGRKPFLDLFQDLRAKGATEEELFEKYSSLHSNLTNERHLRSWFRDQVLHPHETQHTLEEILGWLSEEGLELESTSINGFEPLTSHQELIQEEKKLENVSYERNHRLGQYFPGFFTFCAKRAPHRRKRMELESIEIQSTGTEVGDFFLDGHTEVFPVIDAAHLNGLHEIIFDCTQKLIVDHDASLPLLTKIQLPFRTEPTKDDLKRVSEAVESSSEFQKILRHEQVREAFKNVLSADEVFEFRISRFRAQFPLISRSTYGWHQDEGTWFAVKDKSLAKKLPATLWLSLNGADETNSIELITNSHRLPLSNHYMVEGQGFFNADVPESARAFPHKVVIAKAGEGIIFHALTFHRSVVAQQNKPRYSIDIRYYSEDLANEKYSTDLRFRLKRFLS